MMISVFIQPHERGEALEAYRQWLTPAQEDEIENAPDSAIIRISRGVGQPGTTVMVIEEG